MDLPNFNVTSKKSSLAQPATADSSSLKNPITDGTGSMPKLVLDYSILARAEMVPGKPDPLRMTMFCQSAQGLGLILSSVTISHNSNSIRIFKSD